MKKLLADTYASQEGGIVSRITYAFRNGQRERTVKSQFDLKCLSNFSNGGVK